MSAETVMILIPQDGKLAELCRIRFEWETLEPYQRDPEEWRKLCAAFLECGAIANAKKCSDMADYWRHNAQP